MTNPTYKGKNKNAQILLITYIAYGVNVPSATVFFSTKFKVTAMADKSLPAR